jgi:diguanylate cyclase (GGDEF)-like protein
MVPAHAVAIAERKADTDELTGLANRRALAREMAAGGVGRSALVMLDLDHFKRVNDTLGHPAGDAALKHLAKLLGTALRAGDVAARIGGEEFAVWLPGADMALGMEVAERLRAVVAEKTFRIGGVEYPLTISCGVSACPLPIPHPDNLMATADAALYRAKREGRNRVVATSGKSG